MTPSELLKEARQERDELREYLQQTRQDLLEAVALLSKYCPKDTFPELYKFIDRVMTEEGL